MGIGLSATATATATATAAGGGYVAPSVVNDALDCLAAGANRGRFVPPQTWAGIRGVMTWSVNWDAASGHNVAETVALAHIS